MAYQLSEVTIRTDNSAEGMKKIEALWSDVTSWKLPLLCNSEHSALPEVVPVAKYSHYATDETGAYNLSILGVTTAFFQQMEREVHQGSYQKFEESDEGGDVGRCTKLAWAAVWALQAQGTLQRAFTSDYESTIPAQYAQDGKAHCCLYIAVEGSIG